MLTARPLRGRWRLVAAALVLAAPAVAQQQASQPVQQGGAARAAVGAAALDRATLANEGYIRPPAGIERLVTAPRERNVTLTAAMASPDRTRWYELVTDGMPSVGTFGKPHYYLGGLQVDFRANRARALTDRGATGLAIVDARTAKSVAVEVPRGATVSGPVWSPDGTQLAFVASYDDATELYVADAESGRSRRVTRTPLLATLVTEVDWTADGRHLAAVLVPHGRGAAPARPALESGPLVRITEGKRDRNRVYASLLRDPFEKAQLEYYTTGQLALIDARTGAERAIGAPAMFTAVDVSPDGRWFHVTIMEQPFSYLVPYTSFGTSEEIWDAEGSRLAVVARRPLREGDSADPADPAARASGGSDTARRALAWMPDGEGLSFLQRAPAARSTTGDSARTRRRDRLYRWLPPFGAGDAKALYESDAPIAAVVFSDDARTAFVARSAGGAGEILAVHLTDGATPSTIVRRRGYTPTFATLRAGRAGGGAGRAGARADSASFYGNPGAMLVRRGRLGGEVALLSADGASAYLAGTRYFPDHLHNPPRAFVDRYEVATGARTRMYEGSGDATETVIAPLDDGLTKLLVARESRRDVPNAYVRDLGSGALVQLTHNVDPTPAFTALVRKRIEVTRADGYHFVVRLTLPADYRAGTRLPAMLWLYPYEYTDQEGYDRTLRTENVNGFPQSTPRTIEFLATLGYAVANFDPPIVGDSGRMNDHYVSDLVADLTAVIDELDRAGYVDRARLAIGGHSYGAFSAVNAMVHTPFFRAGIAGDGMYNRTLTPNGFQSERRDLWNGQKTYLDMSPFLSADKLTGALLMYHSLEDQNVGTDPISSIRMMQALEGLGKTAALYMYPYEDHGPLTRETVLDQWARWVAWLDLYVRNGGLVQ